MRDAMMTDACVASFHFCWRACFCFHPRKRWTKQNTIHNNQLIKSIKGGNGDHQYQIAISICQVSTPLDRPRHHFRFYLLSPIFFSSFCERPLVIFSNRTPTPSIIVINARPLSYTDTFLNNEGFMPIILTSQLLIYMIM